jgi:lipopolysaccharide export system protein LptA
MGFIVFNTPNSAHSESSRKGTGNSENAGLITIKSDTFEIDNNKKMVIFSGDIDARRDDFVINCQKMTLFYLNEPEENVLDKSKARIGQIIASGNVRIIRSDGSEASSDKAVYYQEDEKLVLTGSPRIKQGDDFVEGAVITVYLKENRSVVEGAEGIKAKAVLIPSND